MDTTKSANGTALVIHTSMHGLPCCTNMFAQWRTWAQRGAELGVSVHVPLDGHGFERPLAAKAAQILRRYTKLPVTMAPSEKALMRRFQLQQQAGGSLGYYYHSAMHVSWFEQHNQRYEHVWFVEHDTLLDGDMGAFLAYSAQHPGVDYITAKRAACIDHESSVMKAGSTEGYFTWDVPQRNRLWKWSHVERFSARFLSLLRRLMERGRYSYSDELFELSVCSLARGCSSRCLIADGWVHGNCSRFYRHELFVVPPLVEPLHGVTRGAAGVWTHKWDCPRDEPSMSYCDPYANDLVDDKKSLDSPKTDIAAFESKGRSVVATIVDGALHFDGAAAPASIMAEPHGSFTIDTSDASLKRRKLVVSGPDGHRVIRHGTSGKAGGYETVSSTSQKAIKLAIALQGR